MQRQNCWCLCRYSLAQLEQGSSCLLPFLSVQSRNNLCMQDRLLNGCSVLLICFSFFFFFNLGFYFASWIKIWFLGPILQANLIDFTRKLLLKIRALHFLS